MCRYVTRRSDTLTTARRVNTGSYRFVRPGDAPCNVLKIRCPKGRAGSTPALGANLDYLLLNSTRLNEGIPVVCAKDALCSSDTCSFFLLEFRRPSSFASQLTGRPDSFPPLSSESL